MTMIDEDPSIPPLLAAPATFVTDPALADTVEVDVHPVSTAEPTSGPNRWTLNVPTENSVVSLGAASGRWTTDKGITIYTDSHIHFEVKTGAETTVSLGTSAKTSKTESDDEDVLRGSDGYAMVTNKNAYHDAQKQHYLLSCTDDITVRTSGEAKRAVVQADKGTLDLNGKVEVNVAGGGVSIGAAPEIEIPDVKYGGVWKGETPHSLKAKRAGVFNGVVNALGTVHNLATSFPKVYGELKPGTLKAIAHGFADASEWLLDAGEFVNTGIEIKELLSKEKVEGSIRVSADDDLGVSAGGQASFFGVKGASLMSSVWTSVSGLVTASLKGGLFAGVSAMYTSVKGYQKVELAADTDSVVFEAKKNISLNAEGSLIAVGKEEAQIVGEHEAYFTGDKRAWIGTPAGLGWGLQFDAAAGRLRLGQATNPRSMIKAGVAAERSIKLDKEGFALQRGGATMSILGKKIETTAGTIELNAADSEIMVGCTKVLIDA
jgi:hypothetical protein